MFALQQQGRLADRYITRHLHHSRRHHMGYHSGYRRMLRLRGWLILTAHQPLVIRRDSWQLERRRPPAA